jgi:tRNA 2-thiouridine synthesizing protein A
MQVDSILINVPRHITNYSQTISLPSDSMTSLFSCAQLWSSFLTRATRLQYTGAPALITWNHSMHELDTCGLNCPLPLLKAKQALNTMQSGEQLRVRATGPGSQRDFRVFAEQSGHQLLESSEDDSVFVYLLQKK